MIGLLIFQRSSATMPEWVQVRPTRREQRLWDWGFSMFPPSAMFAGFIHAKLHLEGGGLMDPLGMMRSGIIGEISGFRFIEASAVDHSKN